MTDKFCPTCHQELVNWDEEPLPSSDEVVFHQAEAEWLRAPNIMRRLVNSVYRLNRLADQLPIENIVNQNERGLFMTYYVQTQEWLAPVFRQVLQDAATHGIIWPASLDAKHKAHTMTEDEIIEDAADEAFDLLSDDEDEDDDDSAE